MRIQEVITKGKMLGFFKSNSHNYYWLQLSMYTWRKKHFLIGCKGDMFCCQTFEVWSRLLLSSFCFCSTKYSLQEFLDIKASVLFRSKKYAWKLRKKVIWTERTDQKHTNNLPLVQQFALTAIKLQMFGGKTRHVLHPIRTCFFVSCPLLDATDRNF